MLIPIPLYEIVVGLVLKRGVVVSDDDKLANYIESLAADNATNTNTATTYPP